MKEPAENHIVQNQNVLLTVLLLFPLVVFANAGSPMMWFGILHCLILNAIIGCAESIILSKMQIANKFWLIIVANYISMTIGLYFIAPYFSGISGNDDFWGGHTKYGDYELEGFLAGMALSYIATLIIEFPFFYFAAKPKVQIKKIFIPFMVSTTVTNLVLFFVYYWINAACTIW